MLNQSELYRAIDEILWNDWDPIGINDSAARDEYQGYIPAVFNLKLEGASREIIAKKLFDIEKENIGLTGNMQHCLAVADKIVNLI